MNNALVYLMSPSEIHEDSICFALELAQEFNNQLLILASCQKFPPTALSKGIIPLDEMKRRFHLELLRIKGRYLSTYHNWQSRKTPEITFRLTSASPIRILQRIITTRTDQLNILLDPKIIQDRIYSENLRNILIGKKVRLRIGPTSKMPEKLKNDAASQHQKDSINDNFFRDFMLYTLPKDFSRS